jgi:hypothetical protein
MLAEMLAGRPVHKKRGPPTGWAVEEKHSKDINALDRQRRKRSLDREIWEHIGCVEALISLLNTFAVHPSQEMFDICRLKLDSLPDQTQCFHNILQRCQDLIQDLQRRMHVTKLLRSHGP